ncbi:hypothetical protein PaG_03271 [Moesziomyces aphidis]|uniref:DUF1692-domain-containing protein n=1 Tax=Moesziomyces aphidis TaxID=84754 RepID=W3VLU1_MOEAP|nr:hypothetical protein PaG_03271 [Moesziomyces aphidis]
MAELLDSLDRLPKIRQFDAFPKTQSIYTQRSSKGGVLTIISALALVFLLWTELSTYLYGERGYSFAVDSQLQSTMQINMDMTVAMKCHYLTIDVRDAVGDRLHVSDTEFKKDGTTFDIGHADRLDALPQEALDVGKTISKARKKPLYRRKPRNKKFSRQVAFHKTAHLVPDGPACRIYGSMEVKRVTGNLHITTLGHGYLSMERTDHKLMNLSHVIHEFSFGPYFPEISQPLDSSVETTDKHFTVFQYFVSAIPTLFIDARGRRLHTHQYSVTDYARPIEHGKGVPGIFIKYDIEPLQMTIRERSVSLVQFLVRLAGVVGGVWVCVGYAFRVTTRISTLATSTSDRDSPEAYAASYGYTRPGMHKSPSWIAANDAVGKLKDKWANFGADLGRTPGHRKVDSVQQRILSEEGRAF